MPHLTLYDLLGDMPFLGAIVGRGVARSRLGAEVPCLVIGETFGEDLGAQIFAKSFPYN